MTQGRFDVGGEAVPVITDQLSIRQREQALLFVMTIRRGQLKVMQCRLLALSFSACDWSSASRT
jgi:hypothetical protein